MPVYLFFVIFSAAAALAIAAPAAQAAASAPVVQQQSRRLRGTAKQPPLGSTVPSATEESISQQRYSDDDESCSSEGLTPGVCALAFLARPAGFKAPSPRSHLRKQENTGGGLLLHNRARDMLEQALIAEIDSALAGNHSAVNITQLRRLEQELQPVFATLPHKEALPDGSEGGLDYAAARYLLHLHFVRRHSWYVRGLNPAGDGRLPPSEKESLRSRVAGHLLRVLEDNVGSAGFSLRMLAIFVATLEHLLLGDQHELLKRVWVVHGLQPESTTDGPLLKSVLASFMAYNIHSSDYFERSTLSLESASKEIQELEEQYEGWPKIAREIEKRVKGVGHKLSLKDTILLADQILEDFSEISGSMCNGMEQEFSKFAGAAQGLVSLADIRNEPMLNGEYLVAESVEYLRDMGTIDESSSDPHVLVPNYMLSPTNCDMSTSFYDLCCPNSCEHYKERLEHALAAAGAKTNHSGLIVAVVRELLGKAVPADQLRDLDGIASGYNGTVPIHGRAFANWLNKVFPQDCPRAHSQYFRGVAGDLLPDAEAEFQPITSTNKVDDTSWLWDV